MGLSRTKLINSIYEAIRGNATLLEAWGFYLFDEAFDDEPELRNRLMIIYIAGVFDLLDAELRTIPPLVEKAEDEGLPVLAENARQILNFCRVTAKFLSEFTECEQAFIQNLRNQWVHAYLNGFHQDNVRCKILTNGKLEGKTYSWHDYHALIRPCFERGPFDDTLTDLRERALNSWPAYWNGVRFLVGNKTPIYEAFKTEKLIVIVAPEI